jgi:hypothetical protein
MSQEYPASQRYSSSNDGAVVVLPPPTLHHAVYGTNGARSMQARYISAPETAKLVRSRLKVAFPGVRFAVRASTYPGGAALDVTWTEGPDTEAVEAVAGRFKGARLDSGLELKVRVLHWLLPDGTATVASNEGTQASQGVILPERAWMPQADAELVHFAPDYVFCTRHDTAAVT